MKLITLTLENFGVFRGRHTIPLATRPGKPIVLVGGKNGAGKTTLLEAIRLCLYGPMASSDRISREDYLRYLNSKLHSNSHLLTQPTGASVALEFQYGDLAGLHSYTVNRSWEKRSPRKVVENLTIERDGKPLDEISSEHWQDFLRDLIPPGLSQFFFFDGEKIQHLAEDTSDQETLSASIKSLLGIDAVERLDADLTIYLSRLNSNGHGSKATRELEKIEQQIQQMKHKLEHSREIRGSLLSKLEQSRISVSKIEERIASAGGVFARNREELIRKEADLRARIDGLELLIRQHCAGLLPFALVPELTAALRKTLLLEDESSRLVAAQEALHRFTDDLRLAFSRADIFLGLDEITSEAKTELQARLVRLLSEASPLQEHLSEPIHQITGTALQQMLRWIDTACQEIPQSMKSIAIELDRLYGELQNVQTGLRKIPSDDALRPLMEELQTSHRQLAEITQRLAAKEDELRCGEAELSELLRRHQKGVHDLGVKTSQQAKARLVPRIQCVLEEYKDALLAKKVSELQDFLIECFRNLSRKKGEVYRISINPRDFSVALCDRQGHPIPKGQLSAGEKQIYSISMLWALAKASRRPLPMIIDTPLGRLDSEHRRLLIKHYFPFVSHQVLILSTDTEVDQPYFSELRAAVSHSYELAFDNLESSSTVKSGYFW